MATRGDVVRDGRFIGVVAVDGPSGSGKSSASRRLAERLGARYLDTGAMYRAVALAVLRAGSDPEDADAVLAVLADARVEVGTDPTDPWVRLDGERVDAEIRSAEVTAVVSAVAGVPGVRSVLVARQREIAADGPAVVEGRDITTVVAPTAAVRVLLTASTAARAARRGAETGTDPARQAAALRRRDTRDSASSQFLEPAPGVVVLDTTELGLDEVVAAMAALVPGGGGAA